jgi:hypothetical protein
MGRSSFTMSHWRENSPQIKSRDTWKKTQLDCRVPIQSAKLRERRNLPPKRRRLTLTNSFFSSMSIGRRRRIRLTSLRKTPQTRLPMSTSWPSPTNQRDSSWSQTPTDVCPSLGRKQKEISRNPGSSKRGSRSPTRRTPS